MNIVAGFNIEEPPIVVPWGIGEEELVSLFTTGALRHVTDGYYVASCVSLGGCRHMLGFHFRPDRGGRLEELEFYREDGGGLERTYPDWQRRLEGVFGKPDVSAPADFGYNRHAWLIGPVEVVHTVIERFTEEEHVRITKRQGPEGTGTD